MNRKFTITIAIILAILTLIGVVTSSGRNRPTLFIFNWDYYICPKVVRQFERENGVRVVFDYYTSNENMLVKVQSGGNAYDIIVPSGDHVSIMMELGLLQKIDKELLSNYHKLNPDLLYQSQIFDPNNEYSIPYFWGTTGIIYNRRHLTDQEMENVSWDIFADARFAGRNVISFLDDVREVMGIALVFNGFSAYDTSPEAVAAAERTLERWSPNVSQFDSESFRTEIQDRTIWLGMAYNGDAMQVMEENPEVGFTLPREGSTIWMDFLVIPHDAPNPELAHKFINFLLDEQIGKRNTEYVQYATPNLAVYNLLPIEVRNNRNIYPSQEFISKSSFLKHIGEDIHEFDVVWQRIRHLR